MRDIKFRWLASKNDEWDTHFVYGDLYQCCNWHCAYSETHPDMIRLVDQNGGHCNKPILQGTKSQYTWLKDKNWVEIYEGDIIKTTTTTFGFHKRRKTILWKVTYTTSSVHAGFRVETTEHQDWCDWFKCCEIIWNIYEHPDLLEW